MLGYFNLEKSGLVLQLILPKGYCHINLKDLKTDNSQKCCIGNNVTGTIIFNIIVIEKN